MNQGNKELTACPMCGGEAHITKGYATEQVWPHGDFHRVFCGCCQLRQLFYRTSEEAITAWNNRTPTAAAAQAQGEPVAWGLLSIQEPELTNDATLAAYWLRKGRVVTALYAGCAPQADEVRDANGKLTDWGKISNAANEANQNFGQWMPQQWLQLFVKAYNDCTTAADNQKG